MRDLTEGIDLAKIAWPFLKRNMPSVLDTEEEYNRVYTPQWNADDLIIRINANNYHMLYEPGSEEWWIHDPIVQQRGLAGMAELKKERNAKFREKFEVNARWMDGMTKADVDQAKEGFICWINGNEQAPAEGESPAAQADTTMDL